MRRRRTLSVAGVLLAGTALSGCGFAALEPGAAEELRKEVASVTEAAHSGRYQEALRDLDNLAERLETAAEEGDVSQTREERISAAIDAVRLSLEAEIALQK
ncbi:hypothetical protein [Arthrobacter sp. 9E16]|uniref:hypothetical protein n=1 Tax=Arthrobacter sp. 9E16 TaxID=2058888 RepID=UPI000CE3E6F6|nr:hypothetical protein [Arthrobacter sp. 9E16]